MPICPPGTCARLRATECFFQGYGEAAAVDRRLLAYYRCAWAVQDIGAYGERVFLSAAPGEETRRAAVDGFMSLFEPGNVVDLASAPDAPGPSPP